jgi:hypothetical protein
MTWAWAMVVAALGCAMACSSDSGSSDDGASKGGGAPRGGATATGGVSATGGAGATSSGGTTGGAGVGAAGATGGAAGAQSLGGTSGTAGSSVSGASGTSGAGGAGGASTGSPWTCTEDTALCYCDTADPGGTRPLRSCAQYWTCCVILPGYWCSCQNLTEQDCTTFLATSPGTLMRQTTCP